MATEPAESQLKLKYSRAKRQKNAGKRDEINESYLISKFAGNEWKRTNEVGEQFLLTQKKRTDIPNHFVKRNINVCMHRSDDVEQRQKN